MGVDAKPVVLVRTVFGGAFMGWLITNFALIIVSFFLGSDAPWAFAIAALYAMGSLPVCFAVTATAGLVWQAEASKRGWRSRIHYCVFGALCGVVSGPVSIVLAFGWPTDSSWWRHIALSFAYGSIMGGLTGLFAWLIRRPDRDPPNPPTAS